MIDERKLTKGQVRKLNALRKSLGKRIADQAFAKWLKEQIPDPEKPKLDPIADKIIKALGSLSDDMSFRLGRKGYVLKRTKGRGATGFVAEKLQ